MRFYNKTPYGISKWPHCYTTQRQRHCKVCMIENKTMERKTCQSVENSNIVRYRYNAINFLQFLHKRHPIACPSWRDLIPKFDKHPQISGLRCFMCDNNSCYRMTIYTCAVGKIKHVAVESLRWRHNGRDGVSNHQPYDCLLNRLFRRRSKKTPKLRVTGLCAGNSPGTGEFPAQMASNEENVSISWRHHVLIAVMKSTCCSGWSGQYRFMMNADMWIHVLRNEGVFISWRHHVLITVMKSTCCSGWSGQYRFIMNADMSIHVLRNEGGWFHVLDSVTPTSPDGCNSLPSTIARPVLRYSKGPRKIVLLTDVNGMFQHYLVRCSRGVNIFMSSCF